MEKIKTKSKFDDYVNSVGWTFAKTYALKCPHYYRHIKAIPDQEKPLLIAAAQFIRDFGFKGYYFTRPDRYYISGQYYYWTMFHYEDPGREISIINRAEVEEYVLIERRWKWKGSFSIPVLKALK